MSSFWGRTFVEHLRQLLSKPIQDTLLEIEELNRTWRLVPTSEAPSYGRFPGEKEIRLWCVPETTGAFLHWMASAPECNKIVELGTSAGYSAIWLAAGLRGKKKARLDTWEIHPAKIELASSFLAKSDLTDVVNVHAEDAAEFATRYEFCGQADLLFLDADKENYLSYLASAFDVLRPGGILIVDNAVDFGGLLLDFHQSLLMSDSWKGVVLDVDNGIILTRKGL